MANKWSEIEHKGGRKMMSPPEMRERAAALRGAKDNMSPGERDLAAEQWQMTAQVCERLDRIPSSPRVGLLARVRNFFRWRTS